MCNDKYIFLKGNDLKTSLRIKILWKILYSKWTCNELGHNQQPISLELTIKELFFIKKEFNKKINWTKEMSHYFSYN